MTRRRRLLIAGTALAVLAAVVLVVALAPAIVKAGLVAAVSAKTGRQLQIEGTPALAFWPRLTVGLGRSTLSEKDAGSEFAHVDSARLSLAPLPLLAGQVVADSVDISGLAATVIRHADGSLNIDDLLVSRGGGPVQVSIAAVEVGNARLTWRDEKQGTNTELTDIRLTAGGLRADTGSHGFGVDAAALACRYADAAATLDLAGANFADGRLQVARLGLSLDGKFGDAGLKGRLESPLEADFKAGTARLPKIAGKLTASHPRLPMKTVELPLSADARFDLAKPAASVDLTTEFDGSKLGGRLAVERFSPLALAVDLDIDRLDLDRYEAPGQTHAGQTGFAPPAGLDIHGVVRIGSLRMGGLQATNVRLQIGDQAGSRKSAR